MNTETMFYANRVFQELNAKYHFTIDVYGTKENAKREKFFTKEDDGLVRESV